MGPVWASWSVPWWKGRAATGEELGGATGEELGGESGEASGRATGDGDELEEESGEASGGAARQDSDCPCWCLLRVSGSLASAPRWHSNTQTTPITSSISERPHY